MGSNIIIVIAIRNGTGPELATVFEKVAKYMHGRFNSAGLSFRRSPRMFHSHASLLAADSNGRDISDETIEDAWHFQQFCEQEAKMGTPVIFRTAISAQALYIVRERLESVKVENSNLSAASLLLVRDQSQGFYTGYNALADDGGSVLRTCRFDKTIFKRIIAYSLSQVHLT